MLSGSETCLSHSFRGARLSMQTKYSPWHLNFLQVVRTCWKFDGHLLGHVIRGSHSEQGWGKAFFFFFFPTAAFISQQVDAPSYVTRNGMF